MYPMVPGYDCAKDHGHFREMFNKVWQKRKTTACRMRREPAPLIATISFRIKIRMGQRFGFVFYAKLGINMLLPLFSLILPLNLQFTRVMQGTCQQKYILQIEALILSA